MQRLAWPTNDRAARPDKGHSWRNLVTNFPILAVISKETEKQFEGPGDATGHENFENLNAPQKFREVSCQHSNAILAECDMIACLHPGKL